MRTLLSASVLAACIAGPALGQNLLVYDASSGTLPTQQCWNVEGLFTPTMNATDIDFGLSAARELRYYKHANLTGIDFTGSVTVTFRAMVVSGAYQMNPCGVGQRAAVGFGVYDNQGRLCWAGLGSDRVYINTILTGLDSPNNPSVPFSTAGQFRDYRLEINNLSATLFIDNVAVTSVTRLDWPTSTGTANTAFFGGDTNTCVPGQGRVQRFTVTATPTIADANNISLGELPEARTCPGGTISLTASADAPNPVSFRWMLNDAPLSDGPIPGFAPAIASGCAGPTLTISSCPSTLHGALTFRASTICGGNTSAPTPISMTCNSAADVASVGGNAGCDGQVSTDDLIVFLRAFFALDASIADIATSGGIPGPDGQLSPDDLILFLSAFFRGCNG